MNRLLSEKNYIVYVKGLERYVFIWDDDSNKILLQTLKSYAADSQLSFDDEDLKKVINQILNQEVL